MIEEVKNPLLARIGQAVVEDELSRNAVGLSGKIESIINSVSISRVIGPKFLPHLRSRMESADSSMTAKMVLRSLSAKQFSMVSKISLTFETKLCDLLEQKKKARV